MIMGIAMAESTGIYALVVALILIFVNPLIDRGRLRRAAQGRRSFERRNFAWKD